MLRLQIMMSVAGALAVTGAVSASAGQSSRSEANRTELAVYLVRDGHVAPTRRLTARTSAVAQAAVTALLRGPTAAERRSGYATAIPHGTLLRGISIARRVATVDLNDRFQSGGGSASMLLRVAQMVYTLTQFPTVDRVAFRLDGRPVAAIGGEGVVVAPPVGRADYEAQTPAILVEQPLPAARVARSFAVRGSANVFEARLFVELRTDRGALVSRHPILATAGSGTRGLFAATLALPRAMHRATVLVYARSPKNGARIDVVRIPVTG